MDWMDCVLKFSGELLVMVLSLMVAGLNLFYFTAGKQQDNSLAGNFLSRHAQLNPKLYAKNNTIITVLSGGGIFPQAQADSLSGLEPQGLGLNDPGSDNNNIILSDETSILAPNPDSITASIANVVKVYTVAAGDTLKSIAEANKISINTIKWSNPALVGNEVKPGYALQIPPTDGVVVTADSNTTLADLAAKYNPEKYNSNKIIRDNSAAQLLDTIITYNGLDSAEDIDDGQVIIIPGGVVSQAPQPKPAAKPKTKNPVIDNSINNVTSISSGYDDVNHIFPRGYCTYYVANQMKITFGGNAKNWLANARASGYVVGNDPAPHSAVVFTGPKGAMRKYGHVAYVESVNDDGTITVSEMNYTHFNRVDTRIISVNDRTIRGYIYP